MSNGWAELAAAAIQIGYNLYKGNQMKNSNQKAEERQYNYNLWLQQHQQNWLEKMSNTAHQREVADLKAAGLNPLLSANNGASTPSSGLSQVGLSQDNAVEQQERAMRVTSAIEMGKLGLNYATLNSNIPVLKSQANLNNAKAFDDVTHGALNLMDRMYRNAQLITQNFNNTNLEKKFLLEVQKTTAEIGNIISTTAKNYNDITNNTMNAETNRKNAIINEKVGSANQKKLESEARYIEEKGRGYNIYDMDTWARFLYNINPDGGKTFR